MFSCPDVGVEAKCSFWKKIRLGVEAKVLLTPWHFFSRFLASMMIFCLFQS